VCRRAAGNTTRTQKTNRVKWYQTQWRSQPKKLVGGNLGAKMFDIRRITLICLEKRFLKHKMTICSKHLGGQWPLWPPLATPMTRHCTKSAVTLQDHCSYTAPSKHHMKSKELATNRQHAPVCGKTAFAAVLDIKLFHCFLLTSQNGSYSKTTQPWSVQKLHFVFMSRKSK